MFNSFQQRVLFQDLHDSNTALGCLCVSFILMFDVLNPFTFTADMNAVLREALLVCVVNVFLLLQC